MNGQFLAIELEGDQEKLDQAIEFLRSEGVSVELNKADS